MRVVAIRQKGSSVVRSLLMGLLLLIGAVANGGNSEQSLEPRVVSIEWPEMLHGRVVDESKQPVAGASVTISLTNNVHRSVGGILQVTRQIAKTTTNENGEYQVQPAGFPESASAAFGVTVTAEAEGYASWETWSFFDFKDAERATQKIPETLITVQIPRGRKIRGICLGPDDEPVPAASLRGYETSRQYRWANALFKTGADGRFEFVAPPGAKVGMWVDSDRWGPQFVVLPEGDEPLEIRLEQGSVIEGTVRTRGGDPIPGVVVVAESMDTGKLKNYSLPFERASLTDKDGRFRVEPVSGKQRLYVAEAAQETGEPNDGYLQSQADVPPVVPQFVEAGSGETIRVALQETRTAEISGAIRLADGTPVEGVEVRLGLIPRGNGGWISFETVYTDAEGNYRGEIPVPLQKLALQVIQHGHLGFENMGQPVGWGRPHSASLSPVVDDISKCDFVFPARRPN